MSMKDSPSRRFPKQTCCCFTSHPSSYYALTFYLCCSVSLSLSVCAGDAEEWDQHCIWHSELLSGLERLEVSIEQLKQDQEKWMTHRRDWATTFHAKVDDAMCLLFVMHNLATAVSCR